MKIGLHFKAAASRVVVDRNHLFAILTARQRLLRHGQHARALPAVSALYNEYISRRSAEIRPTFFPYFFFYSSFTNWWKNNLKKKILFVFLQHVKLTEPRVRGSMYIGFYFISRALFARRFLAVTTLQPRVESEDRRVVQY